MIHQLFDFIACSPTASHTAATVRAMLVQVYYNNSKIPGGGTLGNLSGSHVALPTVDIGLPQLSMHSPFETAGAKDLEYMVQAMTAFYNSVLTVTGRDQFEIC